MSYQHFTLKERHTLIYLMDLVLNYSETGRRMTQERSTMGFRGFSRPLKLGYSELFVFL